MIWEAVAVSAVAAAAAALGWRRGAARAAAAAAQAEAARRRWRGLFEALADPAVVVDARAGRLLEANAAARELLGPEQAEALERGELRAESVGWIASAGGPGGLPGGPVEPGGTDRAFRASWHPLAGGTVDVWLLLLRDVTAERRLEHELRRSGVLESVGLLAGGVAHDLNNLMAAAVGNVQLARMRLEAGAAGVEEAMTTAEGALLQGRELTRQLLAYARGGAGGEGPAPLGQLVRDTARFVLAGSTCTLELDLPEELPDADLPAGHLTQIVGNLVLNAVQAMPEGGTVRVAGRSLEEAGRTWVELDVEDQGPGVPPDLRERIFEPYVTTKPGGTGLGLFTARSVAREHGGDVRVGSAAGGGARFTVRLPAVRGRRGGSGEPPRGRRSGGGRVLVMDDRDDVRQLVCELLGHLGFEPEPVPGGGEALEALRRAREAGREFRAALLDLTVPGGMNGTEVLARLREIDPGLRAVAVSGYATDPVLADPARYGFDAALAKPFTLAELAEVMERAAGA